MSLQVGFGRKEITPPMGVELAGYGYYLERCCDAVEDPLFARALAFRQGEKTLLIINCDLLGLDHWIVRDVRAALKDKYGLPAEQVLCLSIHTHTGPETGRLLGCGEIDADYIKTVPGLLAEAAETALADFAPVEAMEAGCWPVEDPIGYNRTGGTALDTNVRGWVIRRTGKRPLALASYACHPVTYGRATRVSADYPGAAVRKLEQMGYDGLFLVGVCGDVDPVSNRVAWGSGTPETMARYAEQLLKGYEEHLEPVAIPAELKATLADVTLPLAGFGQRETDRVLAEIRVQTGESYSGAGQVKAAETWQKHLLEAQSSGEGKTERSQVQVFDFGALALVALPYEAFTQLGEAIRAAAPGKPVWVLGNANTTTAYMPTREDLNGGSYAAVGSCIAYCRCPFAPEAPDILVAAAIQALQSLA